MGGMSSGTQAAGGLAGGPTSRARRLADHLDARGGRRRPRGGRPRPPPRGPGEGGRAPRRHSTPASGRVRAPEGRSGRLAGPPRDGPQAAFLLLWLSIWIGTLREAWPAGSGTVTSSTPFS